MSELDHLLPDDDDGAPQPVLAVVGRPNVGKSTLVNRILGRREAVVEDVPGVTRDRVAYDAQWRGRRFTVVDTGGWDPDAVGLQKAVAAQAEIAVGAADAVLFVVDATIGATDADEAVVKVLRRAKKPVVLVANKVDDERGEADAAYLWNLGLGEPHAVSALHGRGSGDLLDVILDALPETPAERFDEEAGPRRVALVGRPNVGKSSLLNRLSGEERVVVDNVAGTTRDPVDSLVEVGGETWRFVDTAGLRRRVSHASGAEYYSSLRTQGASTPPRSLSCCSTPASRSASRTSASSAWRSTPAARWSSPSTSGTSSTRTAARCWRRRSSASSPACSGRRGSTSPR